MQIVYTDIIGFFHHQVLIGANLNFSAGTLSYTSTTNVTSPSVPTTANALAVALPVITLAIIAVLIIVGIFVFLCYTKQKKR